VYKECTNPNALRCVNSGVFKRVYYPTIFALTRDLRTDTSERPIRHLLERGGMPLILVERTCIQPSLLCLISKS
jgi:hypothetical protein